MKRFLAWLALAMLVVIGGCSPPQGSAVAPDPLVGIQDATDHGDMVMVEDDAATGSRKGDKAPDFTVTTVDGRRITLSERTNGGKPVLVYFWTTWCPACQHDLALMREVYPAYKDDFDIVAINMDLDEDADIIRAYLVTHPNPDIAFAPGTEQLLRDYNVIYTSTKVPVDTGRIVLWRGSGELERELMLTLFEGLRNA